MLHTETIDLAAGQLTIETGKMAKQACGSVTVRLGDTLLLVTAVAAKSVRAGMDFMPLTCDYQERSYAAGRIPGSFFRREGRPYEHEVLVCRLMDRPHRPLFPEGWRYETQLIATVVSYDTENAGDVHAITGASAALAISDIPFAGPVVGVRVGQVDGELVAFPSVEQRAEGTLDLIIATTRDAIVMVEGEAAEVTEETLLEALAFARKTAEPILDAIDRMAAAVGKSKREHVAPTLPEDAVKAVAAIADDAGLGAALGTAEKLARYGKLDAVKADIVSRLVGTDDAPGEFAGREKDVKEALSKVKKERMRAPILKEGKRIGGRGPTDVREITTEVGILPRVHGSSLFTRGETQALVSVTLGGRRDEQRIETLEGQEFSPFMMHYNFPPFCVGEAKFLRGTSRREVGHGTLAKRAVSAILPDPEDFPYTLRIVSETLESNGSSSMASVCGASLALMDAGIAVKAPVAGVAMGLIAEGDDIAILTDILGDEDHLGDMDFKVCGTRDGITAVQMDIKIAGLSNEVLAQALAQAKAGRLHILDEMAKSISEPRAEMSQYAPRIITLQINPDKIRDIIGPGGKTIRGITEQTGATVDVEDDGTVKIASPDQASLGRAVEIVKGLTAVPEIGKIYVGTVVKIADFGAFVQILPGTDGLLHISEISDRRTRAVTDVLSEGDEVAVKVIKVDPASGKVGLSRREAMAELAKMAEEDNGAADAGGSSEGSSDDASSGDDGSADADSADDGPSADDFDAPPPA